MKKIFKYLSAIALTFSIVACEALFDNLEGDMSKLDGDYLASSEAGLSRMMPENNGEIIRLGIPPLTEDRRKQLAKQCKDVAEHAKISIRNARRDCIDALKKAVKDGMPEDVQKDGEEKLQKLHDKFVKKVEELYADKEKEIMTV